MAPDYISDTSSSSSGNSLGAKAPLTSRAIFKPNIESNAPHARATALHAYECVKSETNAMRCIALHFNHCSH